MKTRLPLILLLNVVGFALFLSWYLPVNHGFWFPLDAAIFHFFNNGLVESRPFLWLVALTLNALALTQLPYLSLLLEAGAALALLGIVTGCVPDYRALRQAT